VTRRVWITRAKPGADATAARVRAMGIEPFVAPLLEVRTVQGPPIDLSGIGALAFTSANGVEAFASRCNERGLPVFTVGSATAAAARERGFEQVVSADGDVNALAELIEGHRNRIRGTVLHPAAAETIGELPAHKLVVYETVPATLAPDLKQRLASMDAVLLHSPSAARLLADFLARNPAPNLRLICLSQAVASPLRGTQAREIIAAALPNEEALLNLLIDRGIQ
jgi:uroporphyrinogen-III synthase